MPESAPIRASVVIATRNRKDDLRRALTTSFAQSVPVEVVVMDDGSTDGAIEMIRAEFPRVRLYQLGDARGPSFQRTKGAELASSEFLFPIDDDSSFPSARTIEQTLAEFDHPRVGAIFIPFFDVRTGEHLPAVTAPPGEPHVTFTYVGASHALRRSAFLAVGGYREQLFNMGEESDVCVRLLDAGYVVRVGRADEIHHHTSPVRNPKNIVIRSWRNAILYAWHNLPALDLPLQLAGTTLMALKWALRERRLAWTLRGLAWGYARLLPEWKHRRPVRRSVYRLARRLKHAPVLPLAEIERELPPLTSPQTPASAR
jgi:GT2 family glycosyltransferase